MPPDRTPPWLTPLAADAMSPAAAEPRNLAWALRPALPAQVIAGAVEAILEGGEEQA